MTSSRLFYEHSGEGEVYVYFDYDATVVDAVKFAVPLGHRRWSPEQRRWVISEEFWPRLRKALTDYGLFNSSEFEELDRAAKRVSRPGGDWVTLHLQPGAPPEVVKAAYLALAKLHHPDWAETEADRDDRTRKMTKINVAYEALTQGGAR